MCFWHEDMKDMFWIDRVNCCLAVRLHIRQGFDKNLYPQSAYAFRAFGNSFMVYMVLWEQVLTPIYAINEWEAFASLEKHKRKKQRKTQGYKRMCKTKQIEEKGQIVGANARGSYICITYYVFSPISLVLIPSASLCFYMFFRLWARAVEKGFCQSPA